jgi:hypothetical protein
MATNGILVDIRSESTEDKLVLSLYVEDHKVASASADKKILEEMKQVLGMSTETVRGELEKSLRDYLAQQLRKVTIEDLKPDPETRLLFWARYTFRDHAEIHTGLVWYSVTTSETGPPEVPDYVRNAMRTAVHRHLVTPGSIADQLIDIVETDDESKD